MFVIIIEMLIVTTFHPFTEGERDDDRALDEDSLGLLITRSHTSRLDRKHGSLYTESEQNKYIPTRDFRQINLTSFILMAHRWIFTRRATIKETS